jgi:hypothetical protein
MRKKKKADTNKVPNKEEEQDMEQKDAEDSSVK